ncbi:phosphotransferase family protein [Microbacterium sp. VKM Ac-2923]|uniref:phosphotransferase family protein n=1 Tax=Microbacterium sp. VKM Ac-2923 TaxID=2929476 RepID=UPI001FB4146D|nr:phosphotransferase [Microbacterium sp. VKM Ac-2923]MCJ1709452.1 phosphotransferase [Microbacterium sp. VKM Ac-2923]
MNTAVLELAVRDPGIPGLRTLLDPASLSDVVGASVHVRHLRYKPGASVLVAYTTPAGAHWAGAWSGADKPASAERRDPTVRALPGIAWSAGGPARSDRVLARAVQDAERHEPSWRRAEIVRHNPGRRLVVRTGGEYAKTAPGRASAALRAAELLGRAGVPTLVPRLVTEHAWATASWGDGDLASSPSPAHAAAAGAALARLHAVSVDEAGAVETPDVRARSAARALRTVLPATARRVDELARRLPRARRRAIVHGDFSADQVLHRPDGRIRLIDLDRLGAGDPAMDLAGFAVEEFFRTGDLAATTSLFAAYRAAGGVATEADWRAWTPLCALERAIEPFRRCEPHWPSAVMARLERAEDLL